MMARYRVCLAFLMCIVQCCISTPIVLDAFTVEGDIDVMNPFIIDFHDPSNSAGWEPTKRIRIWADPSYGIDGAMYIGTAQYDSTTGQTNFVGTFGVDIVLLTPLPQGWNTHYSPFYWKLQVDDGGYRLHFDDFTVTAEIPHYGCCNYPTQDLHNNVATSTVQASFYQDYAVYFEMMYPCSHPCDTGRARYLYNCDAGEVDGRNFPYAYSALNINDQANFPQGFPSYCHTSSNVQQYCEPGLPPSCDVPYQCKNFNWCPAGYTCQEDAAYGWYATGCNPALYNGDFSTMHGRRKQKTQTPAIREARRSLRKSRHVTPGGSKRKVKNELRGHATHSSEARDEARHESFLFNHRYLHPQCWSLEDLMYDAQNTEYFASLFYWCYGAFWCYSENACGSNLLPRHVYDARLNACLGVRGTVWTDLQIMEVLMSNSTNSSFDINVTNGTIYAVSPVPPEEVEDLSLAFLVRLPLEPSIFGGDWPLLPEGLMNYNQYAYKNFQYLKDWINDVNYESWASNRRRRYGYNKNRLENRDYCRHRSNMCHAKANCFSRKTWPGYACRCKEGYIGDGYFCNREQATLRVAFNASLQLGINETLRFVSEVISQRTNIPPELLDVSKYANATAFKVYDEDGNFEIVINFPFEDLENATKAAEDGSITASDGTNIDVSAGESAIVEGEEASSSMVTDEHFHDVGGGVLKKPVNEPAGDSSEEALSPVDGGAAGASTSNSNSNSSDENPLLIAGGGAAGMLLLLVAVWGIRRRASNTEQVAPVIAMHEVRKLPSHPTDVESQASSEEDGHKDTGRNSGFKEKWRAARNNEDSFTLAQDRSGVWSSNTAEDAADVQQPEAAGVKDKWRSYQNKKPEDSFRLAQDRSGIWSAKDGHEVL